ncbi:hypothetical protein SCANM63S_07265 [Streptomyces canarius]
MSSYDTVRPVSGWKSCRLTPRMKTRSPLTSRSRPTMSTSRKPMRWCEESATVPSDRCSRTVSPYSSGCSAFQVRTSGTTARIRTSPRKSETRSSSALSRSNSVSWARRSPSRSPVTYQPSGSARSPAALRTRQSTRRSPSWRARTVTSARCRGSVVYSSTERVIPPCHHWSWSSMCVASDHLTTVSRTTDGSPGRTTSVRSNSAARWESLEIPTGRPSTWTSSTLSAAPTCRTIRRPAQWAGTSTCRSYTPVGLAAGDRGGNSAYGIRTLVYCGRSSVSCMVHAPGTCAVDHVPWSVASGVGRSWKRQSPSRDRAPERRSTAFMGSLPQEVTSGACQGRSARSGSVNGWPPCRGRR